MMPFTAWLLCFLFVLMAYFIKIGFDQLIFGCLLLIMIISTRAAVQAIEN
jgi:hypothetical protein